MQIKNPFEEIAERLSKIEHCLLAIKNHTPIVPESKPDFRFIAIQDIFKKKICSKPCFYDHLKKGHFTLYKFGNKSFVDLEEFEKAFHGVKMSEVLPCITPKNK